MRSHHVCQAHLAKWDVAQAVARDWESLQALADGGSEWGLYTQLFPLYSDCVSAL